ncbi:MAG: methyltransferase [Sphingomonas bacterium]|nr:methyltransferase [Sphingomonas bacterium]
MASHSARMMFAAIALTMTAAPAISEPANVRAAVAASAVRSADNLKLDSGRKPAELLAFLGLERGMRALDPFGGNLYWAEIIAPAVGPKGKLIVWQPSQFMSDKTQAKFASFAARQKNAALMASRFETPAFAPNAYDFALINLDYHDVYWESAKNGIARMDPDAWLRILYATMKPGAVVGIVDHAASAGGDPRVTVEAMHRIDPAVVRADFVRAGFVLEGESDMLRNPADDHSLSVFDAKIRGHTDRFVLKFRKPAAPARAR